MAEFHSSVFAKHSGKTLSAICFCTIFFGFVSISAASNICLQNKHLILKPTRTYKKCNVTVAVEVTKRGPTVSFPKLTNSESFNLTTIVMLSPRGQNSVHWLRTNIPKDLLELGTSQRIDDVYPYKGPHPAKGTGDFNYQFYLLSQPLGGNVSIDPYIGRNRKNFNMAEFQKANQMELLGVFQYHTSYSKNGSSGRSPFSVLLGIISVVWAVSIGV